MNKTYLERYSKNGMILNDLQRKTFNEFNEADSLQYLNEDIFQCVFPAQNLIIDIGWYGNVATNQGEFRIHVIINENWDFPFNVIHSKSVDEAKEVLLKILKYYDTKGI